MKLLLNIILLIGTISSCTFVKSSPAIWIFNLSDNYIYNVEGNWNGRRTLTLTDITPGGAPSQNLVLKHPNNFFGPVTITWQNAKKQKITKKFTFTKNQLPPTKYHNLDHVYIFLTQDDLELFTRGKMDKKPKEVSERWQKARKFSREYRKKCPKGYGCRI